MRMIRSANERQTDNHGRNAGTFHCGGYRGYRSAAREDAQDRPFIRAGFAYRTGGDAPLVRTNSRTAGGRCICEQRRRADRLLPGRPVTLNLCRAPFERSAHFIHIADQPRRQAIADLFHRSSSTAWSRTEPSDGAITRVQEPFASGANEHE